MDECKFVLLRRRLMESLEEYREVKDEEIYKIIDDLILQSGSDFYIRLSERSELRRALFNSVRRLDILQEIKTFTHRSVWGILRSR